MTILIFGDRVGKQGEIRIGASAVIFNTTKDKILLTKRADNKQWCLPSGGMNPGESISETCIREVKEETGLEVQIVRLIGVYTSPNCLIKYPDGNQVQLVSLCFEAQSIGGTLRISNETTEYGHFSLSQIADMNVLENHVERIEDAFRNQSLPLIK